MSITRWILIVIIITSASIYWIWETNREEGREKKEIISPEYKAETLEDRKNLGFKSAKRTDKYANLFEKIGAVLQFINIIAGIIMIVAVLIVPLNWGIMAVSTVGILVLVGIAYVQTSLIRGLASYFQMKANDYIVRNWEE